MTQPQLNIVITAEATDLMHTVQCAASDTVHALIARLAPLMNAAVNDVVLVHNNRTMQPSLTLAQAGVADNDVLLLRVRQRRSLTPQQTAHPHQQPHQQQQPQQQQHSGAFDWNAALSNALQQSQQQQRARDDPETFRQQALADPAMLAMLQERNPPLAEAVLTGDLAAIGSILREFASQRAAQQAEIERLQADPFNVDNQRRIEELIRRQQIDENYEHAVEHNPAAFGRVVMLYINCKVNNVPVKAFVDSGAQMTIMSPQMARACNLGHLIDNRWQGTAVGVGEQRIVGRVHMAPIMIEGELYPATITILERDDMDFLLGLDMLKAHQAIIDLKANVLRIGTVATPFLGEADIPARSLGGKQMPTQADQSTAADNASTSTHTSSVPTATPTTPQRSAAPPQQRTLQATPTPSAPTEAGITTLIGLGATRDEAIALLRATNNNVELAAGMLFDRT